MKITRVKNTDRHSVLEAFFRGCEFNLERDSDDYLRDWHVKITSPERIYSYDRWIFNSEDMDFKEIFSFACKGYHIDPPIRWPKDFPRRPK